MKSIVTFLLICSYLTLSGQNFSIEFGATYFSNKSKSNLHQDIIGKRDANDDFFYKVQYEQIINNKFNIIGSYTEYPIYTYFRFFKENGGGSSGWNGTNVKRFDLGLMYNILNHRNFILSTNVGIGIQKSIPDGDGCICSDISDGIKPDNFELLNDIEAFAYSNTQIVPVIGLKFGYAFWGRLELFFNIQQVFGYKTIQELRMSYTYKGIEQPEAISYSDGTGRFYALGLGYRFVKPKEK